MQERNETDDKKTALKSLTKDLKKRLGRSTDCESADGPAEVSSSAVSPVLAPGQEVEIPLDALDASPFQLASRGLGKRDVEDLMEAIRANGQIQPILASPGIQDGRFVIQSGHRRCAALRNLGATTVRAIVRELTEREARRIVVGDNLGRKDLSAVEKAFALREYCQAYPDLTLENAATELGIKKRTAQRLMGLLEASEGLRDLFASARVPARPAAALAKIEARDPRRAMQLAERYTAGKLTAEQLEKCVQSGKKHLSPPARKISEVKVSHREVRLSVNLTRSQIQLRAAALEEAISAIAQFLGHVGHQAVEAADVAEFDPMREVTQ
ncbi:ParB/RepB/Spo0J family partition protein [Myxococcota bacterium]